MLGALVNLFFCFFGVWGNFEILIAISQLIWGVGDYIYRVSRVKFIGRGKWKFRGRGVVEIIFIINCNFWIFLICFGGGGGGMKISIYQWIWGFGDFQTRVLCGNLWRNSGKGIGSRGVLEINFIIIFYIFPDLFLVLEAILKYWLQNFNKYG